MAKDVSGVIVPRKATDKYSTGERRVAAPATSETAWWHQWPGRRDTHLGQLDEPYRGVVYPNIDPEASENRFLSLTCLLDLPQARFPGADNRLRPVSNLKLGEDVGDVVSYRLGAQRQLPGD